MEASDHRYSVNTKYFFIALILAPIIAGVVISLLFAIIGTLTLGQPPSDGLRIAFLIPVVGSASGAPFYLILGGTAYWFTFRRFGVRYLYTAFASVLAVLGIPILSFILWYFPILNIDNHLILRLLKPEASLFVIVFGSVFAIIWGSIFVYIYKKMTTSNQIDSV